MKTRLQRKYLNFVRADDGTMMVFGLFLTVAMLFVGGLAADYANAIRVSTYMQAAADSAAHAALIEREYGTLAEARTAGVTMAKGTMPYEFYGDAIRTTDINFGYWDPVKGEFQIDNVSRKAVAVDTARLTSRSNSLATYFLKMVGFHKWDLRKQTVYETYDPMCLEEGFASNVGIKLQSNNLFKKPFCLFTNGWMDFASGNKFESGSIIEMPDISKLSAGATDGLTEALHESDKRNLRILERIQEIYDGVQDPSSRHYRSYITSSEPVVLAYKDGLGLFNWQEGRIHKAVCSNSSQAISFDSAVTLKNGVLITNCILKVKGVILEDAVLITLNGDKTSVNSPSGMTIGKKDNCAAGGGAQVVTMGGVSVSTNLALHNGQIIAMGDVSFTSHADGNWGASIISGGEISTASHGIFRSCGTGMDGNFGAEYFRLAY